MLRLDTSKVRACLVYQHIKDCGQLPCEDIYVRRESNSAYEAAGLRKQNTMQKNHEQQKLLEPRSHGQTEEEGEHRLT